MCEKINITFTTDSDTAARIEGLLKVLKGTDEDETLVESVRPSVVMELCSILFTEFMTSVVHWRIQHVAAKVRQWL